MAIIATGRQDEALDIVQDAMLKLVKRYRDREPQEWGALFTRILQTTIRDWYRRNTVRQRVWGFFGTAQNESDDGEFPWQTMEDKHSVNPEQQTKQQQAMAVLEKVLHDLPLRQQQVFLLRQWEGLDTAQTARAMGCSEGSVKTHYSRAIQRLREQLQGTWP